MIFKRSSGNHVQQGAKYFIEGVKLLTHPRLRRFIVIPLLINVVVFAGLTAVVVNYLDVLTQTNWHFPEVIKFLEQTLKWLVWFFVIVITIIAYGYLFNIVTNFFAAPFYGLLAQRTEELITGQTLADEPLVKLIFRTILREISKLIYFITRGLFIILLMLLLGTIPLLNLIVPVIGGLWSSWSMALQYADYSADNHQTDFALLRKKLRHCKYSSIGFGGMVMACTMIPIVNIIAIPAAVIGGTLYWIDELAELQRPSALTEHNPH